MAAVATLAGLPAASAYAAADGRAITYRAAEQSVVVPADTFGRHSDVSALVEVRPGQRLVVNVGGAGGTSRPGLANTGAGFWGSWAALAGGALVGIGGALVRLTRRGGAS